MAKTPLESLVKVEVDYDNSRMSFPKMPCNLVWAACQKKFGAVWRTRTSPKPAQGTDEEKGQQQTLQNAEAAPAQSTEKQTAEQTPKAVNNPYTVVTNRRTKSLPETEHFFEAKLPAPARSNSNQWDTRNRIDADTCKRILLPIITVLKTIDSAARLMDISEENRSAAVPFDHTKNPEITKAVLMNLLKNLVFVQPGIKLTIHTIFAIRSDKIKDKSKEFITKAEDSSTFLSDICYARIQAKVYEEAGWMRGLVTGSINLKETTLFSSLTK